MAQVTFNSSRPPGIEPTNNLAEQAIRFVVIDRKITQGSRSESGQKWLERIWTVTATCSQILLPATCYLLPDEIKIKIKIKNRP